MLLDEIIIPLGFFMVFLLASVESTPSLTHLEIMLPDEIEGWRVQENDQTYSGKEIYTYIDGAGEVYLAYDYQQVLVRRYSKVGEPELVVELFDMGSPQNAYGAFSHDREHETTDIGQGCEQRGGIICFWKAQYLVTVFAEGGSAQAQNAVPKLAQEIARRIPTTGEKPSILKLLPTKGLLTNRIRYFRQYTILNYHYFLAEENILHLSEHTDCVFADYQHDGAKCQLLLIFYQTSRERKIAETSFLATYLPEAKETGIAQTENGKWTALRGMEQLLCIVFDSSEPNFTLSLIDHVETQLKNAAALK